MTPTVRVAIAAGLLYFAAHGLPTATLETATIELEKPSAEMIKSVADVDRIMRSASHFDRLLWSEVWTKVGKIVNSETDTTIVFSDTRSLRQLSVISLGIAWKRLADIKKDKYEGLGEATERVFVEAIGLDIKPVTPELRKKFVETCNALAWCGAGRG
jgi:hypothetical protein